MATGIERDAYVIANYSEETLEGDAHADIARYVADYAARTGAQAVVVDASGKVVADSQSSVAAASIARRPEVVAALAGHTVTGSRSGLEFRRSGHSRRPCRCPAPGGCWVPCG